MNYAKKLTDFPYEQIKEWKAAQQKLCQQFYRVDKMLQKLLYNKYYNSNLTADKETIARFLY